MTQAPQWEHFSTKSMERWNVPQEQRVAPRDDALAVAARQAWVPAPQEKDTRKASAWSTASLFWRRMRFTSNSWQPVWTDLGEDDFLAFRLQLLLHLDHFGLTTVAGGGSALPAAEDDDLLLALQILQDLLERFLWWDDSNLPDLPSPRDRYFSSSC
jgi:hypothetical protein